jgi:ubiquinone/menaquinone biosynthesis C-methylase UbiE
MDTLESSNNEGRTLIEFLKNFPEDAVIVNIGSLSKKIKGSKAKILNLDISWYPNIDIVADAHQMPFKDESLDGIIIKNVFEHLRDPATVRDELKRVLKKGGKIYAKVPFMQPFHAVPDDYQRYSINGIKEFFEDFSEVKSGIAVGPSSALAWILREYLAILFSFNTKRGYRIARAFFSYFTAPIKYFDVFFRKKKEAHRLASAFYIILEK